MAYISTDEVKEIRTQLKDVLKSKGITGTVKREHYSMVVLSVKSNGKLINAYDDPKFTTYNLNVNFDSFTQEEKNKWFKCQERQKQIEAEIRQLREALFLPTYRDNTDIMTDYFDVSYYTDIKVLN